MLSYLTSICLLSTVSRSNETVQLLTRLSMRNNVAKVIHYLRKVLFVGLVMHWKKFDVYPI